MTLQQLRYVTAVAETGTISKAAQKFFISQPSLTNAIHELEQELGLTIFHRTNRGAVLTPEGDVFLGYARQVLAQVGGKPITEEDVTRFIQAMGRNGQAYNNPKGRAAVLEQMIAQRLFLLDAQRNLYEREPAFKAQLAAVKEQLLMEYAITKCIQSAEDTVGAAQ